MKSVLFELRKSELFSFLFLQRNFVESMAGYSILCYLLQVLKCSISGK